MDKRESQDAVDARRYRWVREHWAQIITHVEMSGHIGMELRTHFASVEPERVDAALDALAAMEGQRDKRAVDSKAVERAVLADRDMPCLYGVAGPCQHPRCLEAHFQTLYAAATGAK